MKGLFSIFKRDGLGRTLKTSRATPGHWTICSAKVNGDGPIGAYARQLWDEGYAKVVGDDFVIPWDDFYRLLDDQAHEGSTWLLGMPQETTRRPSLVSRGSPTDAGFSVAITEWLEGGVRASGDVLLMGGIISADGQEWLLPFSVYQLLTQLKALASGAVGSQPRDRRIALGRINKLARAAGSHLDAYLASTDVVVPETITVSLRETESLGVPVVEVQPGFKDQPSNWEKAFGEFSNAQPQYDLPRQDGGTTHVVLPDAVFETFKAIKKHAPGGRLASKAADDFLRNPYPYLNDGAEAVLPAEDFECAKRQSGLVERDLVASPADKGFDLLFVDPAGLADDAFVDLYNEGEAQKLWLAAATARESGRTAFRWKPHNVAFGAVTDASLRAISNWLAVEAANSAVIGPEELFDLRAYSDRVIGFDGRPIHVPVVTKEEGGDIWAPEIQIVTVSPDSDEPRVTRLDEAAVTQLRDAVDAARKKGSPEVSIPDLPHPMPVDEADSWIRAIADRRAGKEPIQAPRDPLPRSTASLKILHNIEHLDYGAAESIFGEPSADAVLPKSLRPDIALKPHQVQGLAWLQAHVRRPSQGMRGVLLADDMGLGKTLQCLALMAWYRESTPNPKPCLIVAPVSLLENWKAEIGKFLDGSQGGTLELYGRALVEHRLPDAQFGASLRESGVRKLLRPGFASSAAFVLTTYETLRDYELSLGRETWGVFVCDEAQKIKTPGALVTRSAKAMNAEFRVACTGTPVENTLADLWCLFDFFKPAMLGSLSNFTKVYRQIIEQNDDDRTTFVEELRKKIEPFVLRRMKSDVADLPDKIDENHVEFDRSSNAIAMSTIQRSLYRATVADFKSAMENAKESSRGNVTALSLIHKLRMICANPLAVSDPKAELRPVSEHIQHSPKLQWLLSYLERVKKAEEKVIVFSEYRSVQRLLQRAIASKFALLPTIVNGDTTVDVAKDDTRQVLIDRFQATDGFGVIILSTTAVGFGVNVQAANHVVHFTRSWNPAKEDQATDRAYRIGSTKPVWVFCPTVIGDSFESYEQRLAQRLSEKRALSADMLAPQQDVGLRDFDDLQS